MRTGERIKLEREKRGWTQAELGERLKAAGILKADRDWVANREAKNRLGRRGLRQHEIAALAKVFDMSPVHFSLEVAASVGTAAAEAAAVGYQSDFGARLSAIERLLVRLAADVNEIRVAVGERGSVRLPGVSGSHAPPIR